MEKYLVECERLDDFGRGIVHINNKIVFIPNLLPHEQAYIHITLDKKKYMVGKIDELVKGSKDRVESKCKNEDCGCDLKYLKYSKALEYKEEKVKNILKKFSKLEGVTQKIIPSDITWNYRNKVTLKVQGYCGYYKNNTHNFVPIDRHELAKEEINKIICILNKEDLSSVKEIIIKSYDQIMVVINGIMNINNLKKHVHSIYMNNKLVYGDKYVYSHINDLKFLIGSEAFFQVNDNVCEKLYNKIIENIPKNSNTALDLYCGTGTITLLLSKYFNKVIGIEINKDAVECANLNKEINNINNVTFICGDAAKEINNIKEKIDTIVVDPPRAGLDKKAINTILKLKPKQIIYVSCDPVTLARDINLLDNYKVISVTPFDMFPQTHHVECVSVLHRKTLEK